MSRQQRDALDRLLRDGTLNLGGDVAEQRAIFEEMMAAIPVPADITTSSGTLSGIPIVNVNVAGADPTTFGTARSAARSPKAITWCGSTCAGNSPDVLLKTYAYEFEALSQAARPGLNRGLCHS